MPLKLINAGGSLTLSAVLFLSAVLYRSIKGARQRRSNAAACNPQSGNANAGKYLCCLTPAAAALLAELQAIPYHVLDVRSPEEAAADPLPSFWLAAINIPEPQLPAALSPPFTAWRSSCAAAAADQSPPSRRELLLVVAQDEQRDMAAAARVAAAGYDRVAVIAGGLNQLLLLQQQPAAVDSPAPSSPTQAAAAAALLPGMHRDALALLLDFAPLPEEAFQIASGSSSSGLAAQPPGSPHSSSTAAPGDGPISSDGGTAAAAAAAGDRAAQQQQQQQKVQRLVVLDVRRHDERSLYGAIPGAMHLPVDELPSALQLPASTFKQRYHFEQPSQGDVLVLQSRGSRRAVWAGQLAQDAGWQHVFVYLDGVYGWRFSSTIQAYQSYQQWQPPPEPEPFSPSQPDAAAGTAELQQLGLLELAVWQQQQQHHHHQQQQHMLVHQQ